MAIFTSADITNIKNALLIIATRGAAEVEINGRRVKYTDPEKLMRLLETVEADVYSDLYGGAHKITFAGTDD